MKTIKKPVKKYAVGGVMTTTSETTKKPGKKVVVKKTPTYKNLRMGVANQSKAEGRDYTEVATKQDSINYNRGFLRGLKKDKESRNDIDEVEKAGRWEGLNTKKNGGPVKKKAQAGIAVIMKGKKTAKPNPAKKMMKAGGKMTKCKYGCK